MNEQTRASIVTRSRLLGTSASLALLLLVVLVGGLLAAEREIGPAEAAQAGLALTKSVDDDTPSPGGTLNYTLVLDNETGAIVNKAILTDALPAELSYISGTLSIISTQAIFNPVIELSDTIVISGEMATDGVVEVTFQALLADTVTEGDVITNTAVVTGTGALVEAKTAVTVAPAVQDVYLPLISKAFAAPTLQTTQPSADNQWTLSWNDVSGDETGYQLEEATDPNFTVNNRVYNLGANVTERIIQKAASDTNTYYYRVRAVGEYMNGPWSNVVSVVTIPELTIEATTPDLDNTWTVSWDDGISNVSYYELQESHQSDFSGDVNTIDAGTDTSHNVSHAHTTDNVYYYRVRAVIDGVPSGWSNTVQVVGAYFADFDDPDSGWTVRRASTDNWNVFYRDTNDHLQAEVDGTREYIVVSPLRPAPALDYELEMAARFKDVEDRDTYSLIFNGEWDGGDCPNDNLTGCFDRYYWFRVQYQANDGDPYLEFKLQRVIGHTAENDPVTENLIDWTKVSSADPDDWNEWQVKVEDDGDIKIYLAGIRIDEVRDTYYLDNPEDYWGLGVQTKDESDATVRFDYYGVRRSDR
jgi:uncharacterized repeat protein (TIGR01451 family)